MSVIEDDIATAKRSLENDIARTQHAVAVAVVRSQDYSDDVRTIARLRSALEALEPLRKSIEHIEI